MEAAQFRFIVSQKQGNIKAVALFMIVFTVVMLVMVDYLGKRNLGESAELTVISVVVFGQFLVLLPVLLGISRGESTVSLATDHLVVKLEKPIILLSFTELHVPFRTIKSYDLAVEGNSGLVIRLEEGKQSFNLHGINKDQEKFVAEVGQIIQAIEAYNAKVDEAHQVPFKSVYTSNGMRLVAALYLLIILIFGAVLFTQPQAELTYQAIFYLAIGIPFLWRVGKGLRKD